MVKMICVPCAQEFPSEEEYIKHKKSGHQTKGAPVVGPGVPQEAAPTPEFLEQVARIEAKEAERSRVKRTTGAGSVRNSPPNALQELTGTEVTSDQSQPIPISLKYVFVGQCPDHLVDIETYCLSAGGKYFAVAVCPVDKKQLVEREVVKLEV